MIDFQKKILNSDKFRTPALTFLKTGVYCQYPIGTTEYYTYWDEQKDRCINGYTAEDGDYITGYNYFYINFCPMQRIVNTVTKLPNGETKVKRDSVVTFPDFYDYDYFYFQAVQEAEDKGKHICLLKSRRKGYEQPYSEPVLTPTGFVEMGSLKVGDLVMNPCGDPCKVIEIIEQGEQEVWEIELQDGRKVRCGKNHLWSTLNSTRGKLHIKTTEEYSKLKLQQGSPGKYCYPYKLPSINPLHFNQTAPLVDPYVMGVLLGDGYICGTQIRFSTDDQQIVDILTEKLPNYSIKKVDDRFAYVILSHDKTKHQLGRYLKQYGVRVKAENKFIPDDYKYADVNTRLELLQGLMDTDGSSSSTGSCNFVSTSERLIDDLIFICRSLGIRCRKSKMIPGRTDVDFGNGYKSDTLPHWEVCITTEEPIFKLERKLQNLRHREYKYNSIGIKAVRNLGYKEKQRCIRVDHDNQLYITRDFVVTHNSYKGGAMACRNYYLIPNSKTYIYASNKQYLTEDGILTKAWDYMDFIDKNTAWGKKRSVNSTMRKRAGFWTKDEFGNEVEMGYKSEIIGVTLKDNPDVVRGKRAKLILFEEGGSFSELGAAWQIARPSVEQDGVAFGTMIVWGTGGDEGCITEDNLVYTSDGRQLSIKDITKKDKLVGYDNNNKIVTEEPINFINIPSKKECIKLTTNSGRTIECSIDHPILSSNEKDYNDCLKFDWHQAQELVIGNYVAIAKSIPYFGQDSINNARAIGIFIGDGSYMNNSSVRLTSCDIEIQQFIENLYPCVTTGSYTTKDGRILKELRVRKAKHDINKLGISGQTKTNKRLPEIINTCDKSSITELLGGLYDTDGCVSTTYYKKRNKYSTIINLTQSSEELLKQVLYLLQKLGIRGYIYKVNKKPSRNSVYENQNSVYYSLDIHDRDSIINFHKNIKFLVKYKQKRLEQAAKYYENQKSLQKDRGFYYEKIVNIENVGVKTIYNITAGNTHTYLVNGIITHNSAFETMKDMFYNPDGYNCLGFENIWDSTPTDKLCGFFVPQYTNLDTRDDDGNRIYMDDDGNTITKPSLEFILDERRKVISTATNTTAIDRYVAERPITPQEAMLEFNGNIFPKKELQEQLGLIRTNTQLQNHKQVGDLIFDESGSIKWIPKKHGDVTKYPLGKDDDPTGSIVIWEHPAKDATAGLYIIGVDPYDHDQSGTNSLGSSIVYKRFQNFEEYYDIIVAEYTGRPATAEEYYENLRKLALYYNARIMYENERKGLFPYFTAKHCDYLLADQPDIINDIVSNSKVQRRKGCHMNKQIKQWGEGMIKEWLNEEYAPGKKNLTRILSEPLLEELISYNDTGNFDRVMALMQVMIYREQLYNVVVKKKEKENKQKMLFDGPIFAQSWFNDDTPRVFSNDDNVYTF